MTLVERQKKRFTDNNFILSLETEKDRIIKTFKKCSDKFKDEDQFVDCIYSFYVDNSNCWIVQNAVKNIEESAYYISKHKHDFVLCTKKSEGFFYIDGGRSYFRHNIPFESLDSECNHHIFECYCLTVLDFVEDFDKSSERLILSRVGVEPEPLIEWKKKHFTSKFKQIEKPNYRINKLALKSLNHIYNKKFSNGK